MLLAPGHVCSGQAQAGTAAAQTDPEKPHRSCFQVQTRCFGLKVTPRAGWQILPGEQLSTLPKPAAAGARPPGEGGRSSSARLWKSRAWGKEVLS